MRVHEPQYMYRHVVVVVVKGFNDQCLCIYLLPIAVDLDVLLPFLFRRTMIYRYFFCDIETRLNKMLEVNFYRQSIGSYFTVSQVLCSAFLNFRYSHIPYTN